jgi:hypothetical protein
MIVTENEIAKIIEEELDKVFEDKKKILDEQRTGDEYKVYFASRALGPNWSPVHHSWVMLIGPDGYTALSGKTAGAVALDKILRIDWADLIDPFKGKPEVLSLPPLDFGRDDDADEVWEKAKENAKRIGTKEAYEEVKKALKETTWKNLERIVNWRKDTYGAADVKIPIKPPGDMIGKQFHERLRVVFNSYQNDVPYGPSTAYGPAINSNSFAFSLMSVAYGGLPPELKELVNERQYPGSHKNVPMKAPL